MKSSRDHQLELLDAAVIQLTQLRTAIELGTVTLSQCDTRTRIGEYEATQELTVEWAFPILPRAYGDP